MDKSALVIGAGIGGLSASIHLAAKGFRVTLLEKNSRVGGKLNLWTVPHPSRPADPPFRFDTGPSLLTLPLIFQDLFHAGGEDVRNHLPIQRLDPIARYAWPDGTRFDLRADAAARNPIIREIFPRDFDGFARFLSKGESIWNLSADTFLSHAPEQLLRRGAMSAIDGLRLLTTPLRIGMLGNYAKLIDRHIRNPKLRQMLYQYASYTGSDPFRAPATLAVIPHVEMAFGAWYIPGGLYRLAEALESVARKLAVEIHVDSPVEKILVESNGALQPRAIGAQSADGRTFRASAIIANSDVAYTCRSLIDARFRKRLADAALSRIDPGGSGFVLMLGIDGVYPQLAHHNRFMPDSASDPRAIFDTRTIPPDPCIYVGAPTRSDPTQAPDGCETLFVMAPAPALDGKIDWSIEAPRYRQRILEALESRHGLTDLRKRIVVERVMTPVDLQRQYNSHAGAIYGVASNSPRGAFLRPPNRDRDIAGLYFAGGATHPGGGLPLVALSGKIVADLIASDFA